MPEGPLGGPRPLAEVQAEVNVYFEGENISEEEVETVRLITRRSTSFTRPVRGPAGVQRDVVTLGLVGNQITHRELMGFMGRIDEKADRNVSDIEVIF